jgi:hypothetical protein
MFLAGYFFDKIQNKSRGMVLGTFTNAVVLIILITMTEVWHAVVFGFIYGMMDGVLVCISLPFPSFAVHSRLSVAFM